MYKFLFATALASASLTVQDDNPGVLDDPACRALVVAQLKAQNQMVSDWDIKYYTSRVLLDQNSGANIYYITNRKNNQVWEVMVLVHSEQVKNK